VTKRVISRLPVRRDGSRGYANGQRAGQERRGTNNEPLTAAEEQRWAKLDTPLARAKRDALHYGDMVAGLGLCAVCWGWVDDPRHLGIRVPTRRL
jgi:hypothetical protein